MHTDGQLYNEDRVTPPPSRNSESIKVKSGAPRLQQDELLILGIIFLLMTDRTKTDMPLVIALLYILFLGN